MKRIFVYEAEPGDYRFDVEYENFGGYYVEITEKEFDKIYRLDKGRDELNNILRELKKMEVDPWDEEAPTK